MLFFQSYDESYFGSATRIQMV